MYGAEEVSYRLDSFDCVRNFLEPLSECANTLRMRPSALTCRYAVRYEHVPAIAIWQHSNERISRAPIGGERVQHILRVLVETVHLLGAIGVYSSTQAVFRRAHAPISALIGTTSAAAIGRAQNSAHSRISRRRLSNTSPRGYAASTLSERVCANAFSASSRG